MAQNERDCTEKGKKEERREEERIENADLKKGPSLHPVGSKLKLSLYRCFQFEIIVEQSCSVNGCLVGVWGREEVEVHHREQWHMGLIGIRGGTE